MKEFGTELLGEKKQRHRLFNSRYPIISVPMNQVSEESLAIAVSRAGGFPSISGYSYQTDDKLIEALLRFVDSVGNSNLILGIDEKSLLNSKVVCVIKELKISHVLRYFNEDPRISDNTRANWRKIIEKTLEDLPCHKINMKINFEKIEDTEKIYFVKGNDGAGRPGAAKTKDLFDFHITNTPNACLVPTGGIGTAEQVRYYLDRGAVAVGCGTLFAAARESILSKESKQSLISASKESLTTVDKNLNQLGLVFNKIESDNQNHTESLKLGIESPKSGLIFAGHAIDQIISIDSVNEILNKLMNKNE